MGLLLCGSFAVPERTFGQNSPVEGTKRKARSKVMPDYPELAKQTNATGKVKIEAIVSPEGHVVSTKVVGGSPLFIAAAVNAAKQWRFETGPKETTEIIEFEFTGKN
jgi:TonB family protein